MSLLKRLSLVVFTFVFCFVIISLSAYMHRKRANSPERSIWKKTLRLIPCRVCKEKISTRTLTCPHCGDSPTEASIFLYSLTGFSLLLGLQILQIPMLKNERKYLFFLTLVSTLSFLISVLFLNRYKADNFFSIYTLIGVFFMVLTIVHLCYCVFLKTIKIPEKTGKIKTKTKRKTKGR